MVKFKRRVLFVFCVMLTTLWVAPMLVVAGDKVNINTATQEELAQLSGIGPVTSEAIIVYREKIAPFKNKEDIKNVKGIGDKTYEKIKDVIVVE